MNFEERIKYYLGDFYNIQSKICIDTSKYSTFFQDKIYFYKGTKNYDPDFRFTYGVVHPGWWCGSNHNFIVDFPCLTNSADGYNSDGLPVLTKARLIGDKNNGILMKYEYGYHWNILNNFNDSIDWNNKINNIIWRGNCITGLQKQNNRRTFFSHNYSDKYNVGFTKPETPSKFYDDHIEYFKESLSIQEQLKYKYIICLEGNDVATSLKWSLMSNSVVIMSKPMIECWLMEGLLKPYVHYIPLKDDFSDLDEVVEWCKNNDSTCKEIAENSTNFMKQFMDHEMEMKIHNYLVNWYKENVVLQ